MVEGNQVLPRRRARCCLRERKICHTIIKILQGLGSLNVKIKNFQAIKEAELTFDRGVTVIVGASNNGKSSIIRAIEAAINNKGGNAFINYGADACEITVEDNGKKVVWYKHKNSTKSYYEIDGKKLNKIGQKSLEEVGQFLNMQEVQINNDKFRLNFWKQLDFPFLVGSTHYQLFDFISKSKDQETIAALQDKSAEEIKKTSSAASELNTSINTRVNDISRLQADIEALEKYEAFDLNKFLKIIEVSERLSTSIENHKRLSEDMRKAEKRFFSKGRQLKQVRNAYLAVERGMDQLGALEDLVEALRKEKHVASLVNSKKEKIAALGKVLKAAEETRKEYAELFSSVNAVTGLLDELNDLSQRIIRVKETIKKEKEELKTFDACPFCGQPLKNHEVHNE
ncbi:MAG: hypothetical protein EOM23_08510 [Candidatus Moranbacteria bacterium]|nr:hypothetical protein [Candidatus Moranbacteria bacterium]